MEICLVEHVVALLVEEIKIKKWRKVEKVEKPEYEYEYEIAEAERTG